MAKPTSVATKTQSVWSPRAITYLHQVGSEATEVNLPRQFHGLGPLLAFSVPSGVQVSAWLLPPEGPRSEGYPPRAALSAHSTTDMVITEA
jgi:hypothetical protein